jgi:hypothetical protein
MPGIFLVIRENIYAVSSRKQAPLTYLVMQMGIFTGNKPFAGCYWSGSIVSGFPQIKKPGSLPAFTPLSVAMEEKVITNIFHVLIFPESIDIIQYSCIIRNWYVYGFYV